MTKKDHDCFKTIEEAIHVSRAKWICKECKQDVSLMYVLWFQACQNDAMHGYDEVAYSLVNSLPKKK